MVTSKGVVGYSEQGNALYYKTWEAKGDACYSRMFVVVMCDIWGWKVFAHAMFSWLNDTGTWSNKIRDILMKTFVSGM